MPIIVLASRLCPEGMEGTIYALIMSINNLGGIISSQLGIYIHTYDTYMHTYTYMYI